MIGLAKERIENLEVFINEESIINKYKDRLIIYLLELVKERL